MHFKTLLAMGLLIACAGANAKTLVVQMLGEATFIDGGLPWVWNDVVGNLDDLPDGADGFACFSVDLLNAATGKRIGTGIDCLKGLPMAVPGPAVEAVSFFITPGGVLVNRGMTSLGLFSAGIGDADGAFNVMTGSVPAPGAESLIFGTQRFEEASGNARVSGAVSVNGDGAVEVFNCLWQLNLDD